MQKITLKDFLKILGANEFVKIILGTSLIYSGVNHERFSIKNYDYVKNYKLNNIFTYDDIIYIYIEK